MRLCVSQIAWHGEEDGEAHALLAARGIALVEAAPTRIFAHGLDAVGVEQFRELRERVEAVGLTFHAMQALLFSRAVVPGERARTEGLEIFGLEEARRETMRYLMKVIDGAAVLGVKVLVFGSPRHRRRGELTYVQAEAVAAPFFRELGDYAVERGCVIGMEANPPEYGCDWLRGMDEVVEFVARVGSAGCAVHWDCGAVQLRGEDAESLLRRVAPLLCHYHVSAPNLREPEEDGYPHRGSAEVLRSAGYGGAISLEMARSPRGLEGLSEAVAKLCAWYR
jgi:sugar phosphate isomerase/epimerase